MTQEKDYNKAKNVAAAVLGTVGFLCSLSAAGTEDYRDVTTYENERLGYERYSQDDIATQKTTKTLAWTGALSLLAAAGLLASKQKNR